MAGLGICGEPLVSGITSDLSGMSVSSYAVNYLASMDQTSAGPGATDMTNHVTSVAQQCPNTVFVLGGYSQGANVTDIAIGIKTTLGSGDTIPDTLSSRIKAIVTFGNPLMLMGESIDSASSTYGSKAIEFCNTGDPVCGNGVNTIAHLTYATDGSVTTAADQAATLVNRLTNSSWIQLCLIQQSAHVEMMSKPVHFAKISMFLCVFYNLDFDSNKKRANSLQKVPCLVIRVIVNSALMEVSAPAEAENIAVCIRVRPMNERETRSHDAPALACVPKLNVVSLTDPETGAPLSGKGNVFQYDQIFDASSDSHAIYESVGRRIVHSTLSGINGTIFAYGQTSSGKTYTMQGDGGMPFEPEAESSRPGVLQLAVEDIFNYIENCKDRDFLLRVSFLEIYNEVVKDLLSPSEKGANLKLREDPRKGVYVECREEIITNYEDIVTLLQTGNQNRTTGQTAMNEKSSRSHSVFRIVIESKEKSDSRRQSEEDVNGAVLVASLNLVDLAGSESLRHTGAEGIRQREAGNINKSLLTLARVINSLASSGGRGQNAPFRDSKLTRLLQNSLGGNTRTLIICCVTPSDRYIEETKSTLQFAARAKDIKTSATVNEVLDDQTQLRRLKREVHELKKLVSSEALNALKAENEALISEKNQNKTEMARLMGLILSSSSVTKATVGKKRKQCGKRTRETWGPGDFPSNIKTLAPFSPNRYPRKRHSPAKENVNPQTLFCVYEDIDNNMEKNSENAAFDPSTIKLKPKQPVMGVNSSSKNVLDLFSAVFESYHEGGCVDPIAAIETVANEKSASLGDIERARSFDVLADIRRLIVANVQLKSALNEKLVLEQEVNDLRSTLNDRSLNDNRASCDCSGDVTKADALINGKMIDLASTQEALEKEMRHCQDLEMEKTNCQQMAAEEMLYLRFQLEDLKLKSDESRQRFDSEKRKLESALESLQSELPQSSAGEYVDLCSRKDELENIVEEMRASQTVLQLAVAERDEEIATLKAQVSEQIHTELETRVTCLEEENTLLQQKVCELQGDQKETHQGIISEDQGNKVVVEKVAGKLQDFMQEVAQLRCAHEKAAMEKEQLHGETERISEELEIAQRQGYEMSETLMEKEHIAKVLQAQLDAKLMTISQMQTKHNTEVEKLHQTIHDITNEKNKLLADIQEVGAEGSTATHGGKIATTKSIESVANVNEMEDENADAQTLHLEVKELTEKLLTITLELAVMKEHLQTLLTLSDDLPEESELKAAFDKVRADFDNLQEQNKSATEASLAKLKDSAILPDNGNTELPPQQRFEILNENFKRVTEQLENVSRERNDCVEELRALESQLMEVSEERLKLTISVDEQEMKLREVEQAAMTSSEMIATLQGELKMTKSTNASLEASKAELEQNVETMQRALTALQADHCMIMEKMQHRESVLNHDSESSIQEVEQLQARFEMVANQREKLQLDVQSYEETLLVLRQEAKDSSDTIADLSEKMKMLETELTSSSLSNEQKKKELARLADALARSEEEQHEMRLQSKRRLVAAEGKEMALEEKISVLEQQLSLSSTAGSSVSVSMQDKTQMELIHLREKQTELQAKIASLENQLAEAQEELGKQDAAWGKKEAMAEMELARLTTEQKQLHEQLSTLQDGVGASQREMEAQAKELANTKQSFADLSEQKEAVQCELEAAKSAWEEKKQDLICQFQKQFQDVQDKLEECQTTADGEINRLCSVIEELKHSSKLREEDLERQLREQGKSRQEALQAKCNELDDELQRLREKYGALEAQRGDAEKRLQNEIHELSQKYAAAQNLQATYQAKLKDVEVQLEMTENDVAQSRGELQNVANSLKSSQMKATQHYNQLLETQLSNETMEKLVETQKARIDKLEKVKMTTDILDMFRKLKQDRHDLKVKVAELQKELVQAERTSVQVQENHQGKEHRLVDDKDDELKLLMKNVEEIRESLRVEKQQSAELKAEMRAALKDEREKAEHEIDEMQALVKEKMELVEKLESQVASTENTMTKLREDKSEHVSYLEKENLALHVENRELKKRLESLHERDYLMRETGTYDASAAAAAKVLNGDGDESDVNVTKLSAIAAKNQEEPKERERPECAQQ
ncbi:Kinesin-like protein [Phytophthora palmivora]|uniref:Kinesin-like protein n=1 Tax=Phytophthora palmivora TaxID=4796 RepID=A0A2P4YW46_9STRA|nr:Kinesin-like protein [Phytophthora palmivora]